MCMPILKSKVCVAPKQEHIVLLALLELLYNRSVPGFCPQPPFPSSEGATQGKDSIYWKNAET